MLTILGTLLTRSGLVSSVHAFAESSIGAWFWGFLIIVMAVCLFTFIRNRDHLKSEHKLESLVSRESSFLFNNLLLLAACFTILWGTLFPVISEYVQGNKVTVGAPFYNRVALPLGLGLLLLTGVGPLLAWRSSSLKSIRRNFILPGIATVIAAVILIATGMKPWQDEAYLYSLVAFSLGAGVTVAILSEFLRGAHVIQVQTGKNLFASIFQLTRRNTRRYGGYLVHFGVVVIFIGIAGGAFKQSHEQEMNYNDTMKIGPYTLVCKDYTQDSNLNYESEFALLDVYRNGKKVTQMAPEKRFYLASQTNSTMVANHSTLAWDLYVIYAGQNPDTGRPIIKVFLNPLVAWIWIGVLIVAWGTLVALAPNMTAAFSTRRVSPVEASRNLAATAAGD
jgi:cytochrome c-type biogenesis protein CcmF